MCVHEPDCISPNCSNHGKCILGECHCHGNWQGPGCEVLHCGARNCSRHGVCTEGMCKTVFAVEHRESFHCYELGLCNVLRIIGMNLEGFSGTEHHFLHVITK